MQQEGSPENLSLEWLRLGKDPAFTKLLKVIRPARVLDTTEELCRVLEQRQSQTPSKNNTARHGRRLGLHGQPHYDARRLTGEV